MFKNLLGLSIIIGLILLTALVIVQSPFKAGATVSSLEQGSNSTSTYYASVGTRASSGCVLLKGATSTFAGPANGRMAGVLENVAFTGIAKGGALSINFYDATTTNVNLRTGNQSTTTITLAEVYGGTSSTTLMLDMEFSTGLTMCVTGTPASSTVTWK